MEKPLLFIWKTEIGGKELNKKLLRKYSESKKIELQILALQEKLQGVNEEAVEIEKAELHKIFTSTKISFEDYTNIIKGILSKDEVRDRSLEKEKRNSKENLNEGDFYNEK